MSFVLLSFVSFFSFFFFSPYNPHCASYAWLGCVCVCVYIFIASSSWAWACHGIHGMAWIHLCSCDCTMFLLIFYPWQWIYEEQQLWKVYRKKSVQSKETRAIWRWGFGNKMFHMFIFSVLLNVVCVFEVERERVWSFFIYFWCDACRNLLLIGNPTQLSGCSLLRVFASNFYWKVKRII